MNKISKEKLEEIKAKNDILDVVSEYIELTPKGNRLMSLCPFHNDKTPSFTVYPEKGSFYCFGCGTGGDVIEFVKLIKNIDSDMLSYSIWCFCRGFNADAVGRRLSKEDAIKNFKFGFGCILDGIKM